MTFMNVLITRFYKISMKCVSPFIQYFEKRTTVLLKNPFKWKVNWSRDKTIKLILLKTKQKYKISQFVRWFAIVFLKAYYIRSYEVYWEKGLTLQALICDLRSWISFSAATALVSSFIKASAATVHIFTFWKKNIKQLRLGNSVCILYRKEEATHTKHFEKKEYSKEHKVGL